MGTALDASSAASSASSLEVVQHDADDDGQRERREQPAATGRCRLCLDPRMRVLDVTACGIRQAGARQTYSGPELVAEPLIQHFLRHSGGSEVQRAKGSGDGPGVSDHRTVAPGDAEICHLANAGGVPIEEDTQGPPKGWGYLRRLDRYLCGCAEAR